MGGSIQCDLSFATFDIEGKSIRVSRETRTPHMIEENEEDSMNYFLDTDMGYFQVQEKEMEGKVQPLFLAKDKDNLADHNDLWTFYFDGESSKEGAGAGVLLISPNSKTFKFCFTLLFCCTNNFVEYEALLIGLRLASKYGIKIRDQKIRD